MKKTTAAFLIMVLLFATFALSEEGIHADFWEGSRLIGALITMEDLSAYTNEAGILPASRMQEEPDDEAEYVFGNVGGLRLICFTIPDESGDGSQIASNVDEGFSDVHFGISEDGNAVSMEAAISFVPGQDDALFFFNPVLLARSGQVFAMPGDFMAVSAAMNPPGSAVGQTIRDERKHTESGNETSDETVIAIQINAVSEPLEIHLLQFSEDHALLMSERFSPGSVPDPIVPLAETEYLLLETVEKDGNGMSFTRREVIGRDADSLSTMACRKDGICVCHDHEVLWK